jgi:maltose alpha-D-glucosyltransferase/alpha-amylase
MLTLFRRIEDGPNPDFEIAKYLTERAHFDRVPPLAGSIEYLRGGKEPAILALLHGAPPKETDGWTWIIEELDRYFERSGPIHFPERADATRDSWFDLYAKETPALAREHFGIALDAVAMLGRRTAEMHAALAAAADDPVMTPEPVRPDHAARLAGQLRENLGSAFEALRTSLIRLPDEIVEEAALTLSRRRRFLEGVHALASFNPTGMLIRIHGDYRLERVARAKNDWVILYAMDEPCQQLRRAKESPLRDVAGIVWSLGTAIASALLNYTARRPDDFEKLAPWARLAQQSSTAELLRSYRATIEPAGLVPSEPDAFRALLRAYLLDEVLKELRRDLENNRLTSARIPLWGILSLSR